MTVINIPANTMRPFCWRQVIRLSLSLTRMVTWPYLCPFKIDRKANRAPFAISEWLCSLFLQLFPLNYFAPSLVLSAQ